MEIHSSSQCHAASRKSRAQYRPIASFIVQLVYTASMLLIMVIICVELPTASGSFLDSPAATAGLILRPRDRAPFVASYSPNLLHLDIVRSRVCIYEFYII